jgi:hypothetical protein
MQLHTTATKTDLGNWLMGSTTKRYAFLPEIHQIYEPNWDRRKD